LSGLVSEIIASGSDHLHEAIYVYEDVLINCTDLVSQQYVE